LTVCLISLIRPCSWCTFDLVVEKRRTLTMTTHDSGLSTGARRKATGRPGHTLAKLSCTKSFIYQQNRLRAQHQVHMRYLEQDRQATIVRISQAQQRLQQRGRHDTVQNGGRHPQSNPNTTSFAGHRVDTGSELDKHDRETSQCQCDCCRYGLWRNKNQHRPTDTRSSQDTNKSMTPARAVTRSCVPRFSGRRTVQYQTYNSLPTCTNRASIPYLQQDRLPFPSP